MAASKLKNTVIEQTVRISDQPIPAKTASVKAWFPSKLPELAEKSANAIIAVKKPLNKKVSPSRVHKNLLN